MKWWVDPWWRTAWLDSTVPSLPTARYRAQHVVTTWSCLAKSKLVIVDSRRHRLRSFAELSVLGLMREHSLSLLCHAKQTGSGKTHTMWGILPTSGTDASVTEERGITPRVFEQLFSRIQQVHRQCKHYVFVMLSSHNACNGAC